jgi:hypothetical protein
VSINSDANSLKAGSYSGTISFTYPGGSVTRHAGLSVATQ